MANEFEHIEEYSNDQSTFEIAPLDYEIENLPRKNFLQCLFQK